MFPGLYGILAGGGVVYEQFADGFDIDGALGDQWTGATWAVSGGVAINTPSLGAELISNGEFTTDTTGWTPGSGATLTRRDYTASPDIDPTGGADDFGMEVASGGNSTAAGIAAATAAAGIWYRVAARSYSPSANTATNVAALACSNMHRMVGFYRTSAENTWQTLLAAGRATSTLGVTLRSFSTTAGDLAHYDAVSAKRITTAEMFATVGNCLADNDVSAKIARTNRASAGLVLCMDSADAPLSYVVIYLNPAASNEITIDKYVSGTPTNVANIAITYVAGAPLRVVKNGTSFDIYYNGAQVGTTQTISNTEIINNTRHGMFSTDPTVVFDDFSVAAKASGVGSLNRGAGLSLTLPQYADGYAGVLFSFDDYFASVYSEAFPVLSAKRGRGTFYVNTARVEVEAGSVTWAQLQEMDAAGWSIANHTQNHTDLTTVTEVAAKLEMTAAKADLDGQGLTGSSAHLSYPFGNHNPTVRGWASQVGMLTGRTIGGGYVDLSVSYDLFQIPTQGQGGVLETLRNSVDTAIHNKTVLVFYWHYLPEDISIDDFTELVDYIADRYVPFLTIKNLHDLMSGEVTVAIGA